jgi:hypothetical protein
MGYQVVKQPDGKLAIFSSYSDTIVGWNADPDEIIQWFVDAAAEREREAITKLVEAVVNDESKRVYYQFAHTWDEVLEMDREQGGEYTKENAP